MEGRPVGRGRGRARPVVEESVQPAPSSRPAPLPAEAELTQRLENVAVEPARAEAPPRPAGRARGRASSAGPSEPTPPGRPLEYVEVTVPQPSVYETIDTTPAAVEAQEGGNARSEIKEVKAVEKPATSTAIQQQTAPSGESSREGGDQGGAQTAKGSDSFSVVHLKKDLEPVIRRGDKGDKIKVATNFIRVKVGTQRGLFEYRVEFTPTTEAIDLRKKALKQCTWLKEKAHTFDGQTMYLSEAMESEITELEVIHPFNPTEKIMLTFKFIKQSTLLDSVQFYNVLMRRIQKELGRVELGRNFYDLRATHQIPQHKLEIFPGVVTRIDEVEGGLMLCLDASHKVIRHDTALDMWKAIQQDQRGGNAKDKFKEFIINKMVLANYGTNKCYRIDDVAFDTKPTATFMRRNEEVTFKDYYKQQYGLTITDLNQPLLVSKQKPRKSDKQGEIRFVTLIPEFCRMSGLSDEQIKDFRIMKDVAEFTRLTPEKRISALGIFIKKIQECPQAKKVLDDWGLEFEDALLRIEGRIIGAPNLEFNPRFTLKPAKADFGRDATSNACFRPVPLRRFLVFCSGRDRQKAENMVKIYKQVCGPLGINAGPSSEIVTVPGNSPNDFRAILHEYAHADKVQFVLVMMPFPRDDVYGAIKRFCVVERPIPSQVVLAKTLNNEKNQRSVMQKIALQINCKLGGALWALKIPLNARIMFVGVDVYHDPKRKSPSVMALVASMDTACTRYFSKVFFQKPHQENLESLISVFVSALEEFRDMNDGCFPDRIVVFRDGVSDGQWDFVKATEIQQMSEGIKIACPDKNISFTFCVVQKKINERFFTIRGSSSYDNPAPGSVLDHTVTRRYNYDFFVVSQLVRQGTVSPTHFIVLEDTADTKPDLMQKFAFATTFMYYNWCGTIRVPAMCQYAHKLAYLTGQHLKAEPHAAHSHNLYYL